MSSAGGVRSPGPVQDWRGPGESRQMRHLSQSAILEEVGPPRLVRVILMLLSLTVFGFIGRSAVTELEETTKASGEVVLSGSVLSVQHLEGGVIKKFRPRWRYRQCRRHARKAQPDIGTGATRRDRGAVGFA